MKEKQPKYEVLFHTRDTYCPRSMKNLAAEDEETARKNFQKFINEYSSIVDFIHRVMLIRNFSTTYMLVDDKTYEDRPMNTVTEDGYLRTHEDFYNPECDRYFKD